MFVVNPVVFGDDLTFGLNREASLRRARGESCIDATVGVLMNDDGTLAVLPTVVSALNATPPSQWAGYAATTGPDEFCAAVKDDALGAWPELGEHAVAVATPGGTGALRTALRTFLDRDQAYLTSSLCWSAYSVIASATERRQVTFQMLRDGYGRFDVEELDRKLSVLVREQGRALLVLNDPCHNPTGYSMTAEDWAGVADVLRHHASRAPVTIVLDAVYAAFSPDGLGPALSALAPLCGRLLLTVAWSASKMFTCYGLRAGALIAVAPDPAERQRIRDTLACHCCGTWANCNHGALAAITRLLREPSLRAAVLRDRDELIALLARRSAAFDRAARGRALCRPSYSGGFFTSVITSEPERVAAELRAEGIYVVPLQGAVRVALSSLRTGDVSRLVTRLAAVLAERETARKAGVAVH